MPRQRQLDRHILVFVDRVAALPLPTVHGREPQPHRPCNWSRVEATRYPTPDVEDVSPATEGRAERLDEALHILWVPHRVSVDRLNKHDQPDLLSTWQDQANDVGADVADGPRTSRPSQCQRVEEHLLPPGLVSGTLGYPLGDLHGKPRAQRLYGHLYPWADRLVRSSLFFVAGRRRGHRAPIIPPFHHVRLHEGVRVALNAHERAALVELAASLEDADPKALATLADLSSRLEGEMAARPGSDAVRAIVLRAIPELEHADTLRWREAARGALDDYATDVGSGDPTMLLARHPAWAGLARYELARLDGDAGATAVDRAERIARLGFASVGDGRGTQRGTVLWALSERADEIGWRSRARVFLQAASEGPFDDPSDAARIALLRGLSDAEDQASGAAEWLETAARSPDADARTRVHARWVLSALARDAGDPDTARSWLDEALEDCASEPDAVRERLQEARRALEDS